MRDNSVQLQKEGERGQIFYFGRICKATGSPVAQATIDSLPDNVFLEVFDFYRANTSTFVRVHYGVLSPCQWWKKLTQVCRRWRSVIFGSPRRLDLQIVCTHKTPTRTSLYIWPSFRIWLFCSPYTVCEKGQDNLIATVERRDPISKINIYISRS